MMSATLSNGSYRYNKANMVKCQQLFNVVGRFTGDYFTGL